jgi:hypothetical protein
MDPTIDFLLKAVVVVAGLYVAAIWVAPNVVHVGKRNTIKNSIIGLVVLLLALNYSAWGPVSFLSFLPGAALTVAPVGGTGAPGTPTAPTTIPALLAGCGDTKTSTLNVTAYSVLNTSGAQAVAVTTYAFEKDNGEAIGILSTGGAGGALSVGCGKIILLQPVRTDGDGSGVNSQFKSIVSGPAIINGNGDLEISVGQPTVSIKAKITQHGIMQARAYDLKETAWIYSMVSPLGTATEWISTPAKFQSTTNNSDYSVGSGGQLHVKYYVRSTRISTNFNDRGWCIIYAASTAVWDKPVVTIGGVVVPDTKSSLNADESRAYGSTATNGVYCTNADPLLNTEVGVEVNQFALQGVDPAGTTGNLTLTLLSRGQFLSKDGVHVAVGLVDDAAAPADVFTKFVINQGIA